MKMCVCVCVHSSLFHTLPCVRWLQHKRSQAKEEAAKKEHYRKLYFSQPRKLKEHISQRYTCIWSCYNVCTYMYFKLRYKNYTVQCLFPAQEKRASKEDKGANNKVLITINSN